MSKEEMVKEAVEEAKAKAANGNRGTGRQRSAEETVERNSRDREEVSEEADRSIRRGRDRRKGSGFMKKFGRKKQRKIKKTRRLRN